MVDQRVDLGGQPAAGATDRVISRLVVQALELGVYRAQSAGEQLILVIRLSPPRSQ